MVEQQTKETTMEARQTPLLVDSQSNQDAGLPGLPFNIPYLADFEDGWVSHCPLLYVELQVWQQCI